LLVLAPLEAFLPGLVAEDLGVVGLPLSERDGKALKGVATAFRLRGNGQE